MSASESVGASCGLGLRRARDDLLGARSHVLAPVGGGPTGACSSSPHRRSARALVRSGDGAHDTAAAASDARFRGSTARRRHRLAIAWPSSGRRRRGTCELEPDSWRRLHPLSPIVRGGGHDRRRHPALALARPGSRGSERLVRGAGDRRHRSSCSASVRLVTRWRIETTTCASSRACCGGSRCAFALTDPGDRHRQVSLARNLRRGRVCACAPAARASDRRGSTTWPRTRRSRCAPGCSPSPRCPRARGGTSAGETVVEEERVLTTVPTGPAGSARS